MADLDGFRLFKTAHLPMSTFEQTAERENCYVRSSRQSNRQAEAAGI